MALNIKDPEAHNLALLITEETGETITRAVTEALRERLDRIRRQRKQETTVEDLLAIGARCAQTIKDRPIDHGALLYDDRGLPR
ncbi:MAG: type II toxin-antitoxin system VapB family antitoxin [Leptospirillum sp.]